MLSLVLSFNSIDTGHYLPTETIIDKLSSVHPFVDCIQLHLSRGIRWDSDHTLTLSDELVDIMHEMKRGGLYDKNVYMGLDFFDYQSCRRMDNRNAFRGQSGAYIIA